MRTLTLALSHLMGEGMAMVRHRLTVVCPANSVAGFSVRRQMEERDSPSPVGRRERAHAKRRVRVQARSSHCFAPSIRLSVSAPVAAVALQ